MQKMGLDSVEKRRGRIDLKELVKKGYRQTDRQSQLLTTMTPS